VRQHVLPGSCLDLRDCVCGCRRRQCSCVSCNPAGAGCQA
jgi:hypothetical protein